MRDKPKTSGNGKKRQASQEKRLRIEHVYPEGQRSFFSNHITVQHTNEGEFTISFFEVLQPLLLGEPEDVEKQFSQLESAKATCLARVVIAADRMPKLIGALITNYETYEKDTGKSAQTEADKQETQKHAG